MRFLRLVCGVLWLVIELVCGGERLMGEDAVADHGAQATTAALRLVVVTDDDFLAAGDAIWCTRVLNRALEEFRRIRPETELQLEFRPAGPPASLCGGRSQVGPRRAIGFLCDRQTDITGFYVGVPTGRELAALVEDADEVAVLSLAQTLQAQPSDAETEPRDLVVEALHQRTVGRVLRHYRPLVHQIKRQTSLAEAAARLQPALAADRGERFLVVGLPDALRWLSAQQHTETMRHWCEAMLPSVVGRPVDTVWPDVAALLWERQPWQLTASDDELVDWYTQASAAGPVVLWVQSAQSLVGLPDAAGDAAAAEPPLDEQIQQWLDRVEHRVVTLPTVAQLLRHRQDQPVDLQRMDQAFTGWIVLAEKAVPTFIPRAAERRLADTLRKLLAVP